MRVFMTVILMLALSGLATATDLGHVQKTTKTNSHVGIHPGTPDGRQGGENMASAVPIAALPFSDNGNTSDNVNDYDAACPYSGSTSPDVVYSYTPVADEAISVDLCGSGYDTKTYIFDSAQNEIACNDDAYFDDTCGVYVSLIEEAALMAGETYYIIIDGYGGDAGDYILNVMGYEPPPPCIFDCVDGEGEPAIVDGYEDDFNGGCNSPEFGSPFSNIIGNWSGAMDFCGQAGWYLNGDGGNVRDTDWYTANIGETGIVEWTLDAEQESYGFLLGPIDCDSFDVIDQMLIEPCAPLTMVIQGNPGEMIWLWVGASTYAPPANFDGHEYWYSFHITGLDRTCPTESTTFGRFKCLYR